MTDYFGYDTPSKLGLTTPLMSTMYLLETLPRMIPSHFLPQLHCHCSGISKHSSIPHDRSTFLTCFLISLIDRWWSLPFSSPLCLSIGVHPCLYSHNLTLAGIENRVADVLLCKSSAGGQPGGSPPWNCCLSWHSWSLHFHTSWMLRWLQTATPLRCTPELVCSSWPRSFLIGSWVHIVDFYIFSSLMRL